LISAPQQRRTGGDAQGVPTSQNFDTPGTTFKLSNAAAVLPQDTNSTGSFLRLVCCFCPAAWRCRVYCQRPGTFNSIAATFDFRITPPSGAMAADGLGFALLNTAAYGTNGAAPYFSEETQPFGFAGNRF
jgi:hypothetical protein